MSEEWQRSSKYPRASQGPKGCISKTRNSHTDEFWDGWLSVGGGVAVGTATRPGSENTLEAPDEANLKARRSGEIESTRSGMKSLSLMSLVDALDGSRIDGLIRPNVETPDEVIRCEELRPDGTAPATAVGEAKDFVNDESEALGAA